MKIKALISFILIFHVVIFIALATHQFDNVNEVLITKGECHLENNSCHFFTDNESLRIKFNQTPIPEEEIYISAFYSNRFSIDSAFIEGVNMYMGKTPVIFEKTDEEGVQKGVFFLGSCNIENMQWRMLINYRDRSELTNTQQLILYFTTDP